MQVIDVKGSMVGTVKDVGISIGEKDISLIVAAKTGVDVEIPWSNVQSIEDVVLLNKSVEIPVPAPMVPPPPPPPPPWQPRRLRSVRTASTLTLLMRNSVPSAGPS